MRPATVSCWQLLKCLRLGDTTWRATNIKFSYLQTITNSSILWTQKAWAPDKSDGLKSCQGTTSGLIITKAKLMELLMPYFGTSSGMLKKKKPSKLRIQKTYINYISRWLIYLDWASQKWVFRGWSSRRCSPFTKSSSAKQLSYHNLSSFRTPFKAS